MFAEAVVLFGGKGGVGKTTCAAAAALAQARARPQRRVRLVSTDPAHSLEDSLAGLPLPANLEIVELDTGQAFSAFRARHGGVLAEIARRGTFFDDRDIALLMNLSLPGLDEMMALLEMARLAEERPGELLICDTAPTGHTLRLLEMPAVIGGWIAALEALLAKHRYLRAAWGRAGAADGPDRFLEDLKQRVGGLAARLRSPDCRFVPVTLAERLAICETADLLAAVARLGIAAPEILVNRLRPPAGCAACESARAAQQHALAELFATGRRPCTGLPLRGTEVRGAALLDFWDSRFPLPAGCPSPPAGMPEWQFEGLPEPPPSARLLIFGGKGGVGKTTLACAAARQLARRRRVLLVSADPAHSLADCLGTPLGPAPAPVAERLDALEIDADREWDALRRRYAADVAGWFERFPEGVDLPFDRPVLERFLELAPPGLDEIMALARLMDLLAGGLYEMLVLDSAASGHLVRLLEMPSAAAAWLRAAFEILLKYRRVWRAPRLSERLVEFSKHLKLLRRILRDPAQCRMYVVAMATRLALEETRDLVQACRRLDVPPAALFLNLLTPQGGCALCRAQNQEEAVVTGEFRRAFPELPLRLIWGTGGGAEWQAEEAACAAN